MFKYRSIFTLLQRSLSRIASTLILIVSIMAPLGVIYMFGFPQTPTTAHYLDSSYNSMLIVVWMALTIRALLGEKRTLRQPQWMPLMAYVLLSAVAIFNIALHYHWLAMDPFLKLVHTPAVVIITLLIISLLEISDTITQLLSHRLNPSSILAVSFVAIILMGSGLLMLPNCTHAGITYIDALFTSASAVCVTGLNAVSTATTFTTTGQSVIMLLIQIGGLGIMTITSFVSLFFMGQSSLRSQLLVSDLLSSETISGLGRMLLKIILVTLVVEAVGAILLYSSVAGQNGFDMGGDTIFFAIFHSISAFCNAGFSTLPGNIYDPAVRNIAAVPSIISWLVIFGGLGFPIFSNILAISALGIRNLIRRLLQRAPLRRPRLWSLNSYIVLRTTVLLLVGSYLFMMAMEWNNALAQYDLSGKLSQGLLMAVTTRTAGFNGVDMQALLPATIVVTILLMWIGGGPQSTAGGIKVTTLYVAIKNTISIIRGSSSIETYKREISNDSSRRAFAVIALSLFTISISVIILTILEPKMEITDLTFEVVSAISTVGLGLGITPELSAASKMVVILLMYVGRVGLIGIAMSLVRSHESRPYSLPSENALIN